MLLLASESSKGPEDLTTNSYFFASLNTLMSGGKHASSCCLGDSYLHGWPLTIMSKEVEKKLL